MKRVVVFRNGSIGNTLVAVPLIRALKRELGAEYVAVVVDPLGEILLSGLPYVDELFVYDRRGPEGGIKGTLGLVRKLRSRHFDCAILAKRFFRNEMIAYLSGVPRRIGFVSPGKKPFKLTDKIPYSDEGHIVDLTLKLLEPLGLTGVDPRLEIAPYETDRERAQEFLRTASLEPGGYIACHFGGTTLPAGMWSAERYGELGQLILEKYGKSLVLLTTDKEHGFDEAVRSAIPEELRGRVHLCSSMPLRAVASLINASAAFIGNDSGPSHLAGACGKRAVVLYGQHKDVEYTMNRWKPKGENVVAAYSALDDLGNMQSSEVFELFVKLIERSGGL